MLGRTASGLFWMTRYLERAEATARLLDAGLRIALTRAASAAAEWESILASVGQWESYCAKHGTSPALNEVIDHLLIDRDNPASIIAMIKTARDNARGVRTALTREVWEAINEEWMALDAMIKPRIRERDLPAILTVIRRYNDLVRGSINSSMLRNDIFNFLRIGKFIERADNTARILDVKYYLLLPSVSHVGSPLDIVQWETILRSVSAQRSYRWLYGTDISAMGVARYLILNPQLPRSLCFCYQKTIRNLDLLASSYGERVPAHDRAAEMGERFFGMPMETIFASGLHEYLTDFIAANAALAASIERDYRFEVER